MIVLDALDEALGAGQILERLLIPLAQARRADGSPVCRLLVGTRPWSEFAPLFDLARQAGEVLDLDAIPAEERRCDLADYVAGLLELLPGYSSTAHRRGRRAFADAVATSLVDDTAQGTTAGSASSHRPDQVQVRWGEFLVAALYTHTATLTDPTDSPTRSPPPRSAPQCRGPCRKCWNSTSAPAPSRRGAGRCSRRSPGRAGRASPAPCSPRRWPRSPASPIHRASTRSQTSSRHWGSTCVPPPTPTAPRCTGCSTKAWPTTSAPTLVPVPPTPTLSLAGLLDGLLGTVASDAQGRRWDLAPPTCCGTSPSTPSTPTGSTNCSPTPGSSCTPTRPR